MEVSRFDVFLVSLDPTIGHEIRMTRPCAVVSLDEMNHASHFLRHPGCLNAPRTAGGRKYCWHGPESRRIEGP